MSVANSVLVALIVMSIVFFCLIALSFLIKLQSFIFSFINQKNNIKNQEIIEEVSNNIEVSTGELMLTGVDEKTTALIMAIVSDELKIPLCELQFKSIKLLNS
jgi:hypothetical protein